jgi:hypothetical protein
VLDDPREVVRNPSGDLDVDARVRHAGEQVRHRLRRRVVRRPLACAAVQYLDRLAEPGDRLLHIVAQRGGVVADLARRMHLYRPGTQGDHAEVVAERIVQLLGQASALPRDGRIGDPALVVPPDPVVAPHQRTAAGEHRQ